jgi:signal transduction histidine kinase
MEPVPLNMLFQSLNHVFSARASEKDLPTCGWRTTPLWVRSDLQLLQRLLSNLVENAMKYTVNGASWWWRAHAVTRSGSTCATPASASHHSTWNGIYRGVSSR